ncbi:hypothetical protein ACVW0J_004154 [Bradyrhizobium sp. i1.7.7]
MVSSSRRVSEEFEDVDSGERHHAAEHAQHEDADRDVEQHHQRDELLQRADAVFADGIGDRAEHAERRDPHDQPHDPKQHGGGRVDDRCDQRALLAADERKANTEQDREEQHLEHVVARQRIEGGAGDHIHQEGAEAAAGQLVRVVGIGVERLGVERRGIDVHAVAGTEEIGEQQTDHEGDRRHHLEIDQRLDADPADLLEVAGTGNAVHDDAEHDRGHDHRDQLQEGVAEDLEPDGEVRNGHPQDDAKHQRGEDLDEQRGVERLRLGGRCRGDGRHGGLPRFDASWTSKRSNNRARLSRPGLGSDPGRA